MQRHLWEGTQPRPAPAEGGQVPPGPLGRDSAALVHENGADAPPTPGGRTMRGGALACSAAK